MKERGAGSGRRGEGREEKARGVEKREGEGNRVDRALCVSLNVLRIVYGYK